MQVVESTRLDMGKGEEEELGMSLKFLMWAVK